MSFNQSYLNFYFNNVWRNRNRSLGQYMFSGWALIDKVSPTEKVIDVGCGDNPFKGKIQNIIGIDPAFPEADFNGTIEEYAETTTEKFDVAFCLGSINFGEVEQIENQISSVIRLLKSGGRIYWRCNPGRKDHGNKDCESIDFYNWSFEEHVRLSEKFGCKLIECKWDSQNRIYAEWRIA